MSLSIASHEVLVSGAPPQEAGLERREFLAAEMRRRAGDACRLLLTVRAPQASPEVLLQVSDSAYGMLWDPLVGPSWSGFGAAARLEAAGADRFEDIRRQAETLWPSLVCVAEPGLEATSPRLFGGFAFDVGAATDDPWSEFGDASFTLPRFLYARDDEGATLTVALSGEELARPGAQEHWLGRIDAILLELAMNSVQDGPAAETQVLHVDEPDASSWTTQINAIRDLIAAGSFEKIVAARRSRVELASPLAAARVMERLGRGLRASTRFAFCRDQAAFLGATPERLVSLSGRQIDTEALAGTLEACGAEQAEQLLASGKDLREHQLVVDAILRRLEPLCESLEVPGGPSIRELREVLHLCTPLRGRLAAPRHVLELVEALHPTPAVGGVPTRDAMRWIADNEPDARGWYAAPIGWFDASGDGEFAVALRSAVLRGSEAWVYAGAGIVRGSDPQAELSEIALKRLTLLRALGAR